MAGHRNGLQSPFGKSGLGPGGSNSDPKRNSNSKSEDQLCWGSSQSGLYTLAGDRARSWRFQMGYRTGSGGAMILYPGIVTLALTLIPYASRQLLLCNNRPRCPLHAGHSKTDELGFLQPPLLPFPKHRITYSFDACAPR